MCKEETSDEAVETSHETIVTVKNADIEKQESIEETTNVSPSTSDGTPKIKEVCWLGQSIKLFIA